MPRLRRRCFSCAGGCGQQALALRCCYQGLTLLPCAVPWINADTSCSPGWSRCFFHGEANSALEWGFSSLHVAALPKAIKPFCRHLADGDQEVKRSVTGHSPWETEADWDFLSLSCMGNVISGSRVLEGKCVWSGWGCTCVHLGWGGCDHAFTLPYERGFAARLPLPRCPLAWSSYDRAVGELPRRTRGGVGWPGAVSRHDMPQLRCPRAHLSQPFPSRQNCPCEVGGKGLLTAPLKHLGDWRWAPGCISRLGACCCNLSEPRRTVLQKGSGNKEGGRAPHAPRGPCS